MLRGTRSVFPDSRLMIAKILLRSGAVEEAKQELRAYLAVPGIENQAIVERWLAEPM
jgi:hypothetical protein